MSEPTARAETLQRMRDELFRNLEEADLEFSRVRIRVERMESDMRLGAPEPPEYSPTKGTLLPHAESRVLDLFRELLKLEDKIRSTR